MATGQDDYPSEVSWGVEGPDSTYVTGAGPEDSFVVDLFSGGAVSLVYVLRVNSSHIPPVHSPCNNLLPPLTTCHSPLTTATKFITIHSAQILAEEP
jgi:hypothetical protein